MTNWSSFNPRCDGAVAKLAPAVAGVSRGDAAASVVSGTQPLVSARHLLTLPALTLRPSSALLNAGLARISGLGEGESCLRAAPGVSGVHGARGDGVPTLGEIKPVRGLAARAVM